MCTDCFLVIFELSNTNNIGNMPGGDHCAVWGCDNDGRYPEKQKILPHVGILRFHSPKSKKDVLLWARAINRDQFKVTKSTKVCSNHFVQGYKTPECSSFVLGDGSLTEGQVCEFCLTAAAYEFPVLSKPIETVDAVFSGKGALQQLPWGSRRLKWFA